MMTLMILEGHSTIADGVGPGESGFSVPEMEVKVEAADGYLPARGCSRLPSHPRLPSYAPVATDGYLPTGAYIRLSFNPRLPSYLRILTVTFPSTVTFAAWRSLR